MLFSRYSSNYFALWWRSLDKPLLLAICILLLGSIVFSYLSTLGFASNKIFNDSTILFKKHISFMIIGFFLLIFFSLLNDIFIKKNCYIFFSVSLILLFAVYFVGIEVKGAKRWLEFFGYRIQPVEFVKPFFVIYISSFIFKQDVKKINYLTTGIITFFLIFLLISQPDYSQSLIILFTWFIIIFISGISFLLIFLISVFSIILMITILFLFKEKFIYIFNRLDLWLNSTETNFQSEKALNAIKNGGFFGQGIGEGNLKYSVPEAHTDYVLAIIAEEFGIIAVFLIILALIFIAIRVFSNSQKMTDKFKKTSLIGLISLILLQSLINLGVTINILPTTGMTFPLFSYGGSSLLSSLIIYGLILNLTRKRL